MTSKIDRCLLSGNTEIENLLNTVKGKKQASFIYWPLPSYISSKTYDDAKIAAVFVRSTPWQKAYSQMTTASELFSFFKDYFLKDRAIKEESKKCLIQLIQQIKQESAFDSALSFSTENEPKKLYFDKLVNQILELTEGQKKLLLVKKDASDMIFYLFSKKGKKIQLEVIGIGNSFASMLELAEEQEKIPFKICYTNLCSNGLLGKKWLTKLLRHSGYKKEFDLNFIIDYLKDYKSKDYNFDNMVKKSDRCFKSIICALMSFDQFSSQNFKKLKSHLYLRMELLALLELYDKSTKEQMHEKDLIPLRALFFSFSQDILYAYNKGFISNNDLHILNKELIFIHENLQNRVENREKISWHVKNWGMTPYIDCELEDLQLTPSRQAPIINFFQSKSAFKPYYFSFETNIHSLAPIFLNLQPLEDKNVLLGILRMLKGFPSQSSIHEVIGSIQFPVSLETDFVWNTLNKKEAIEVMEILCFLAKELRQHFLDEDVYLYGDHTLIIKMQLLVRFLTFKHYSFRHEYIAFPFPSAKEFQRISSKDIELIKFKKRLSLLVKPKITPHISVEEHDENLRFLDLINSYSNPIEPIEYYDLLILKILAPDQKFVKKYAALQTISRKRKGLKPLTNSFLLAALYTLKIDIGSKTIDTWKFYKQFKKMFGPYLIMGSTFANGEWRVNGISDEQQRSMNNKCKEAVQKKIGLQTQEAIADDPEKVIEILESKLNEKIQQLKDSRRVKDHFVQFNETSFSKEEKKALLQLLRKSCPQTEIIGFIEKYPSLMFDTEIRNFLDAIFFNSSIIKAFEQKTHFFKTLPLYLSNKIQKAFSEYRENPKNLELMLFFIEWNEKLQKLYLELYDGTDSHEPFFQDSKFYIQHLLKETNLDNLSIHALLTAELHLLFNQNELSTTEIFQALFNHTIRKNLSGDPMNIDSITERLIQNKHSLLIDMLRERNLSSNCFVPLLNALVQNEETWHGTFPYFYNKNYKIDLQKLTVTSLKINQTNNTTLPSKILIDPFYKQLFGELDFSKTAITFEEDEGVKIYKFRDKTNIPCSIEDEKGFLRFYKTFPSSSEPLQAISFSQLHTKRPEEGFFSSINNMLREERIPTLPFIFDLSLFVNPNKSNIVYAYSNDNQLLFEIHLNISYWKKVYITHIKDLRENSPTHGLEVMCGSEIAHPLIDSLTSIEHPSQLLVWGKSGEIHYVELPRFDLKLMVKNEELILLEKAYEGYYVDLQATDADKQGISFSLLLKSKTLSFPSKLIIPDSGSFEMYLKTPLPIHGGGIAWIIWLAQIIDSQKEVSSLFKNCSKASKIPYFVVDCRPCTKELVYQKKDNIAAPLEIAKQLLILGKFEEALHLLQNTTIESKDFTTNNKKEIVNFINKSYSYSYFENQIKLKFVTYLYEIIKNEASQHSFKKALEQVRFEFQTLTKHSSAKKSLFLDHYHFKPQKRALSIQEMEAYIKPSISLSEREMAQSFIYSSSSKSIFLGSFEIDRYFIKRTCTPPSLKWPKAKENIPIYEKVAWDGFIQEISTYLNHEITKEEWISSKEDLVLLKENVLETKLLAILNEKKQAAKSLNDLLNTSKDIEEQLSIFSKAKKIATYTEVMVALLRDTFQELHHQHLLPKALDPRVLKEALLHFFDCEIRYHLATICLEKIEELIDLHGWIDQPVWETETANLYKFMTMNRRYLPEQNPELLLFEALKYVIYRSSGTSSHQLEILQNILNHPTGITLAATGVGKTTMISQLWALMKATGKNLITLKVLPTLYDQTLELLQKDLTGMFKKYIYPFRFNLKTSLEIKEKIYSLNEKGEEQVSFQTISLFKKIYEKMLYTILEKGIIISDYKSFPLLEEKFIKLCREIKAMNAENVSIPEMQLEHLTYLRKILILIANKQEVMMDEFDQPSCPINRIQVPIEQSKKPAKFITEKTLHLYELLLKEDSLLLKENLQNEVSSEMRKFCLHKVAKIVAKSFFTDKNKKRNIYKYIIGKNESILSEIDDWSPQEKDLLALMKDQFCTYLPLTLSYRGKSKYVISDDGKKILPCFNGEKHDAKFGSILEEINYTIQETIQEGIHPAEFNAWLNEIKKDWMGGIESAKERFQFLFPEKNLDELEKYSVAELINEINEDNKKIWYFLKQRLDNIQVSGAVVSMDPQNSVSMSRSVSAISATIGCPDALHSKFNIQKDAISSTRCEMVLRLIKRVVNHHKLLDYDPRDSEKLIRDGNKLAPICALIDGAGGFITINPAIIASQLATFNRSLKKVGFHKEDGVKSFYGQAHANIQQTGFYYRQPHTRGTDVLLPEDGYFLLTLNNGTLENFNQHEGRARRPGQKIILAKSKYSKIHSLGEVIQSKIGFEAKNHADYVFMAKKQELYNILRSEARHILLSKESLEEFFQTFDKFEKLFISAPAPDYMEPGSYFERNKQIKIQNKKPLQELLNLKEYLEKEADNLHLIQAKEELQKIVYPQELLSKMQEFVFGSDANETEIEVELEEEMEVELEQEREIEEEITFELEKEKQQTPEIPFYPPRLLTYVTHQISQKVAPCYDEKLFFTDSFIPLSRTDPLYKRAPFDSKMYRIGAVKVELSPQIMRNSLISMPIIEKVIVGDLLDDLNFTTTTRNMDIFSADILQDPVKYYFVYDIRTKQITDYKHNECSIQDMEQLLNEPFFKRLITQIKFFDGQIEKYSNEEIALLKGWFGEYGKQNMRNHFENDILKNRTDLKGKYLYSQLWKVFEYEESSS